MTRYTAYNLILGVIVLVFSAWLLGPGPARRRGVGAAARVALLLTLMGYPWDFFAIRLGVWSYPQDPGPRLFDVPVNDLVFMWLCTYLTCSVLIAARRGHPGRQGNPEREDAR